MINYATYQFYKIDYWGKLSNDLFNSLIPKASREIDKVINRDIKEVDLDTSTKDGYKIMLVACQLVDFLNKYDSIIKGNNISSKSIDGVSIVYNSLTKNELEVEKAKILDGLPQELTRFI